MVGCRGGSRYSEGVCGFLGIQKIQKNYMVIIPRFHADQTSSKNGPYFLGNIFYLVGFTYDFGFWKKWVSKNYSMKKKTRYTLRNDDHFWCVWWVQEKVEILDFKNVQIWKDNIFLKCFHNFSCIFLSILVINTGGEGPKIKILEVPKIIQRLLQYVRGP